MWSTSSHGYESGFGSARQAVGHIRDVHLALRSVEPRLAIRAGVLSSGRKGSEEPQGALRLLYLRLHIALRRKDSGYTILPWSS
jgi:hypothetical protein